MNYLKLKQLTIKLNISKSKIYLNIARGLFPQPIKIGRSSFWPEEEIDYLMRFLAIADRNEMEIRTFVEKIMEERRSDVL